MFLDRKLGVHEPSGNEDRGHELYIVERITHDGGRLLSPRTIMRSREVTFISVRCTLCLALGLLSILFLFLYLSGKHAAAASSGEETIIIEADPGPAKYNADHAPQMSRPVQSQLHRDVVRVLRTAQKYKEFAELLDNMTESVIRHGITVFAPSDGALSNFQKTKTKELSMEDVVRFHVITGIMNFSTLLRSNVGSRLTTDVTNITILVTNATPGEYEVDDAVIVHPDLYTDVIIAVHGINAVFNTSKVIHEGTEDDEPVIDGGGIVTGGGILFPPYSRAFKTSPIKVKGVAVFQFLVSFAGLFLSTVEA